MSSSGQSACTVRASGGSPDREDLLATLKTGREISVGGIGRQNKSPAHDPGALGTGTKSGSGRTHRAEESQPGFYTGKLRPAVRLLMGRTKTGKRESLARRCHARKEQTKMLSRELCNGAAQKRNQPAVCAENGTKNEG
jgi:hypothetical protein